MLRWFRRTFGKPDLDRFLNELSPHHPGRSYSAIDRYRDYRQLFLSTPLGRKVLWDVFYLCRLYQASMNKDTHVTAFNEGKRDIGLRILAIMNAEPAEPQQKAEKEDTNG